MYQVPESSCDMSTSFFTSFPVCVYVCLSVYPFIHLSVCQAAIVGPDVDWSALSLSHELTGGLIRNAVLSALSVAIKEQMEGQPLLLTQQHLISGAKLQLR